MGLETANSRSTLVIAKFRKVQPTNKKLSDLVTWKRCSKPQGSLVVCGNKRHDAYTGCATRPERKSAAARLQISALNGR